MKRKIISLITALALCLSLCPTWTLAADWEQGPSLCSHHQVHTETCGYVPPSSGQDCTHEHDEGCFTAETLCVHQHTEDCYPEPDLSSNFDSEVEPSLCTHECGEDSGCITLTQDCPHVHDEFCGYIPEDAGSPCTFACPVCPIEALIDGLPRSVTPDNRSQVEDQLSAILTLYAELTADEQEQLDLSRCLDLQTRLDAASAPALLGESDEILSYALKEDKNLDKSYGVLTQQVYDTRQYSLTVSKGSAIAVQNGGSLRLQGSGKVIAQNGAGVEVQTGGALIVEGSVAVTGTTYGLNAASGAAVKLSGGMYTGNTAAIRLADGNYAGILEKGYAYFDASGNQMEASSVASAKTVEVKACTDHSCSYSRNGGRPTHHWICKYCGAEGNEMCTFPFDPAGVTTSVCVDCGRSIHIDVNQFDIFDWIYDSTAKPANTDVAVTLDGDSSKPLVKNTDYTMEYTPRVDVGEIRVTVTGITYHGTFTKTYTISQAKPAITWTSSTCAVEYDGSPVEAADLPGITITAPGDLSKYLQYSYKTAGSSTDFTEGLPTNAGTYEIKASLPEQQNYEAAETNPCLELTIGKISPVISGDIPVAVKPTYSGASQALVTPGRVRDGAVIEFKLGAGGSYSENIPTGINAGTYEVWYRIKGTDNYIDVPETKIAGVTIQSKRITPVVEVSPSSFVYDSSKKEPEITVKDGQTVLDSDQYKITWTYGNGSTPVNELRAAGTYKATISQVNGKNYTFANKTAQVEITAATQGALKITGKPSNVYYGDTITLDTTGGSGNGSVKWTLSSGPSTIGAATGVLEIKGTGTLTVTAERTVANYEAVKDTWTFTVKPKPVVAEVTIASKVYDSTNTIADNAITAAVNSSDLVNSGDKINITSTGLTGTYDDVNVGTNKPVTLVSSSAPTVTGADADKYSVSFPAAATADITPKAVDVTVTLSGNDLQTDNTAGIRYFYYYDGAVKTPDVAVTYTEGGNQVTIPSGNYTVSCSDNKKVGTAAVKVTANADGNYTFKNGPVTVNFEIKKAQAQLTKSPEAKNLTYAGAGVKQDLVNVGTAAGGKVVYSLTESGPYTETVPQGEDAGTYTVYYKVEGGRKSHRQH